MNDEKKIGFSVELENNCVDLWAHGDDETLVDLAVAATANIVAAACGNDVKEAEKLLQDVKIGLDAALDQALEHPTQEINPEDFKAIGPANLPAKPLGKGLISEEHGMEGQGVYSPKEQYKQMFIEAIGKRPGSMVMWRVLDEIGFFNSPASANHHLNVPGGLLIHSLNVAKAAMELCEAEQFAQCDKNVVLTAALLHDVCKAGKYIAKPEGGYRYRDTRKLGYGEESVILIQHWMHLTEKEMLAIRWHMGAYTGQQDWETLSKVYDSCPEALCVHMADMIATHIMEVE